MRYQNRSDGKRRSRGRPSGLRSDRCEARRRCNPAAPKPRAVSVADLCSPVSWRLTRPILEGVGALFHRDSGDEERPVRQHRHGQYSDDDRGKQRHPAGLTALVSAATTISGDGVSPLRAPPRGSPPGSAAATATQIPDAGRDRFRGTGGSRAQRQVEIAYRREKAWICGRSAASRRGRSASWPRTAAAR